MRPCMTAAGLMLLLLVPGYGYAAAGGPVLAQSRFAPDGSDLWESWAPRAEIRPACTIDPHLSRGGADGSLRISCRTSAEWGGWRREVRGIIAGQWYRFDAYYRVEGVPHEMRALLPRLDWLDDRGRPAGLAEYAYETEPAGSDWRHVWALVPAPAGAARARVSLLFGWTPGGTPWPAEPDVAPLDRAAILAEVSGVVEHVRTLVKQGEA